MPKKILSGTVIKDSLDKTITVFVERSTMHPKYKKTIKRSSKYLVHDENNVHKIGDKVSIIENRPVSKTKKWILLSSNQDGGFSK